MLDLGLSSVELVAAGRMPMIRSSSSKVEPAPEAAVEGLEVFLTLYCKLFKYELKMLRLK